jgi:hypothetical protein
MAWADRWKTAKASVTAAVNPIVKALRPATKLRRDPWYSDDERRAAVNAASPRAASRWIPRRGRWLR